MENGQRGGVIRVAQVEVEALQRGRGQQTLVDDGAAREAGDIEILDALALGKVLDLVATEEELPFELIVAHRGRVGPADEDLLDVGTGAQRLLPEHLAVHRHGAPAEDEELGLVEHRLGDVPAARLRIGIVRQEHHAHAKVGILEELVAHLLDFGPEKLVRDLRQHAGAVAGLRIGVHRATVNQVADAGQRLLQDRVGAHAFDARDQAHAAGVMFRGRVIESAKGFRTIEDGLI